MTPKERAKFLCDSFYLTTKLRIDSHIDAKNISKECAIICANEILEAGKGGIISQNIIDKYWAEVKKEIEKL